VPPYKIIYLDRKAYRCSVDAIPDLQTRRFADQSLRWWDRHFSWKAQGCAVLCDTEDAHLCYLFYKIDRYRDYITFHNVFTPHHLRRHGYAKILLGKVFAVALAQHVRRFRITSISKSLDFYLPLGFVYWGVNSIGDYYCDLPLPAEGLEGLRGMVECADISTLIGPAEASITRKTGGNEQHLGTDQRDIYDKDVHKMGEQYLLEAFTDHCD